MSKRFLGLALLPLLVVGVLLLLWGTLSAQGPPFNPVPPERRLFDADGNKVFDNLDALIAPAGPQEPFEVIVLFTRPLEEVDFAGLRGRLGPFPERRRFHSISGISTVLTKAQIQAAAILEVVRQIELNIVLRAHLNGAREWTGVDEARADFPDVDGNADGDANTYSELDIVIAIIDTGIDTGHVDLPPDKVIAWKDFTNDLPDPYDEGQSCVYHGTHVASIAAGEGNGNSAFRGVAPGAALVGLKVLEHFPQRGGFCGGTTSDINAAIQWIIDNKLQTSGTEGGDTPDAGIEVANMSLGAAGCSDGTDSMSLLVDLAVEAGVVMVVSAGNDGPETCTVGNPAAAAQAITVGAAADVDEEGFVLIGFSSRGPTFDDRIKPDIAAPGVTIMAASGGTSSSYKNLSGTSMSSPFTAGAAALVLDADPSLTPREVKDLLMLTAHDFGPLDGSTRSGPRSDIDWGAGLLDVYRALKAAIPSAGVNIDRPQHQFFEDSVAAEGEAGDEVSYELLITDTTLPIGATLIAPTWDGSQPDMVMELENAAGDVVASDTSFSRQATIRFGPTTTEGPYTLRIFSWPGSQQFSSGAGGPYLLDISAPTTTVAIELTTDGSTPFGNQGPGITIDTTAIGTGTNDVQTVTVTTGLADLLIQTTRFTDGVNTWALGTAADTDVAKWEFSIDGIGWTIFTAENLLIPLTPSSISSGGTVDIFFRLTLPTAISHPENQFGATVTITAVEPP